MTDLKRLDRLIIPSYFLSPKERLGTGVGESVHTIRVRREPLSQFDSLDWLVDFILEENDLRYVVLRNWLFIPMEG